MDDGRTSANIVCDDGQLVDRSALEDEVHHGWEINLCSGFKVEVVVLLAVENRVQYCVVTVLRSR